MDYIDIGGNGIYNEIIPKIKEETEMATAKKTASGKWWARGYNKYFDAYKSFTKSTKREAERAAREYSLLVPTDDEIADAVSKIDDPSVTLQEAAKEYAESRSNALSPSTMKNTK